MALKREIALLDELKVDKEQYLDKQTHEQFAQSRKNLFSQQVLQQAFQAAQEHIDKLKTFYIKDQEKHLHS